jgi:hypothetical protein
MNDKLTVAAAILGAIISSHGKTVYEGHDETTCSEEKFEQLARGACVGSGTGLTTCRSHGKVYSFDWQNDTASPGHPYCIVKQL